jgi:hypothetical protein
MDGDNACAATLAFSRGLDGIRAEILTRKRLSFLTAFQFYSIQRIIRTSLERNIEPVIHEEMMGDFIDEQDVLFLVASIDWFFEASCICIEHSEDWSLEKSEGNICGVQQGISRIVMDN